MSEYETDVPSFSLKLYVLRSIRYPEDKGGDIGINDIVLSIAVHPLMTYSYVVSAYQAAKKEKKRKKQTNQNCFHCAFQVSIVH